MLNEFYKQKIQQIHIVGEYADLMVRDYDAALQDGAGLLPEWTTIASWPSKYFQEQTGRSQMTQRNTFEVQTTLRNTLQATEGNHRRPRVTLHRSRCRSWQRQDARVLVHKLASLLLLEDVKHEQLLMLTFSRAAATEFKQRLMRLTRQCCPFRRNQDLPFLLLRPAGQGWQSG